jgi:hypothetical protein
MESWLQKGAAKKRAEETAKAAQDALNVAVKAQAEADAAASVADAASSETTLVQKPGKKRVDEGGGSEESQVKKVC